MLRAPQFLSYLRWNTCKGVSRIAPELIVCPSWTSVTVKDAPYFGVCSHDSPAGEHDEGLYRVPEPILIQE
eukprot:2918527-Prorocentrum_lima.AAC.1